MEIETQADLFKIIGDKSRLIILKKLYFNNEICACKFLDNVSCKQATLSHHLSVLEKNNLINKRKDGKRILYSCNKSLVNELIKDFLKE